MELYTYSDASTTGPNLGKLFECEAKSQDEADALFMKRKGYYPARVSWIKCVVGVPKPVEPMKRVIVEL